MHKTSLLFLGTTIAVSGFVMACGGNGNPAAGPDSGSATDSAAASPEAGAEGGAAADVMVPPAPTCATVVSESTCDPTLRPFVFVHGTYGSGDNFAHVASLLTSNGYCSDHIVAVEYDSLGDSPGVDCTSPNTPTGCGKIDAVVTAILAKFPQFTQVDLAGHSQGTQHCGNYIGAGGVGAHADKIAHYFNFSGVPNVGGVQTLSLSSHHDLSDTPHHAFGTATCAVDDALDGGAPDGSLSPAAAEVDGGPGCNVIQHTFANQDHFAVAASKDTFIQVYTYLTGKAPKYTDVQCGDDPVTIEGLGENFADNVPNPGKLEVREVTAPRAAGTPDQVITPDMNGHFTAQLKRGAYYEFAGFGSNGVLIGYQYFTPFIRTNRLVRFLSPASKTDGAPLGGSIAAMTTDLATRDPNSVTLVARWSGGAFRSDLGATLTVDGTQVLTKDNAPAPQAGNLSGGCVGLFLEDANKDGKTELGLVTSAPFIAFSDVSMQAKTPAFVQLSLTAGSEDTGVVSKTAVISNWASSGALINVFFQ